jgi:hypothetical protein
LPGIRKVEHLRSLDLGGETSLSPVREVFGAGFQVSIAPPVKLLASGSLAELKEWTLKVLADNQGGSLVILYHLEPQYPLASMRAWHTWLRNVAEERENKGGTLQAG